MKTQDTTFSRGFLEKIEKCTLLVLRQWMTVLEEHGPGEIKGYLWEKKELM